MTARFIQIHTLHSYPAALLNRDDSGLAKRMPFGGTSRIRISSQCLKRHWRIAEDEYALKNIGVPMGVRSRETVNRLIATPLLGEGHAEPVVVATLDLFMKELFQESAKAKKARERNGAEEDRFETKQAVLLGQPEIDYLLDAARGICAAASDADDARARAQAFFKEGKANLAALKHGAGLEAALFGRMVTSDILARTTAAIHVAHAFTVHAEETESDYFTVVDDLLRDTGETGSAGIFDTELTSGLYYGYVVVDLPTLRANLAGADDVDELAAKVVRHLAYLIATVSPGAKLGSTAPYGWAQLMLIEAGTRQPRSLANAFRDAIRPTDGRGLLEEACAALARHVEQIDAMYGCKEKRWLASIAPVEIPGSQRASLDAVISEAANAVTGAARA
jgi:CRISPR system Cascade subunit CasC